MTERLKKLRAILGEKGLDGLMLTGEVSRLYATGLKTSSGVLLLTPRENVFITDFRYIEAAKAKLIGLFTVEQSTTERNASAIIKDRLPRAGRLGFESDIMTVRSAEGWKKVFAGAGNKGIKMIAAGDGIRALRAIKDAAEIEAMRKAQRIAEKALDEVLPLLRPGLTERALCAELVYRLLKNGAERMSFDPIVASGPNGSMPHAVPSDRAIEHGDFVTMDFGCVYDGYCSDMTRTVAVGGVTDEMRKIYTIVLEAQTAGIAAARAGVKGKEIDGAARKVIADAGYGGYFGHGFGHGLGLEVHEQPNANPSEEAALPAGTVISAEPGIYLPGRFGVRIEDVVVLTGTGCENLMSAPKELIVV
ncbi:MAG: Xaa-Pro peptidase family protein [Oscillospiraceae bacterium]|jgi:Xaa-Pro aminopeptidase|nr:Xaa-Pro peptidase family protein [Oscillospiraceae bacterium]